jgi:hypothetical protein
MRRLPASPDANLQSPSFAFFSRSRKSRTPHSFVDIARDTPFQTGGVARARIVGLFQRKSQPGDESI